MTITTSPSRDQPISPLRKMWVRDLKLRMECHTGRRCQRSGSADAGVSGVLDTHDRPTLIIVRSHIGYGAPHKQDTREAHGEPLGPEEARLAKQFYGCDPDKQFYVPDGVTEHFKAQLGRRGSSRA